MEARHQPAKVTEQRADESLLAIAYACAGGQHAAQYAAKEAVYRLAAQQFDIGVVLQMLEQHQRDRRIAHCIEAKNDHRARNSADRLTAK